MAHTAAATRTVYDFSDVSGEAFALGTNVPDPTTVADDFSTYPNVAGAFNHPAAVVFGAGVQGAAYVDAAGGTQEYVSS